MLGTVECGFGFRLEINELRVMISDFKIVAGQYQIFEYNREEEKLLYLY
jgi:hypothetical protein